MRTEKVAPYFLAFFKIEVSLRVVSQSNEESVGSWMFDSVTVQSTRIRLPSSIPIDRPYNTKAFCTFCSVSGLRRLMFSCNVDRPGVFSSAPKRQKAR